MFKLPTRYIDQFNIALIVLTCAVAHVFPFHLLLVAYAVLGPAHYLTQISWMHDRRYFSNLSWLAPAMGVLTVLWILLAFHDSADRQIGQAIALSLALGLAAVSILPTQKNAVRALAFGGCACLGFIALSFAPVVLFIAVLVPTVMHVFVFTAAFMLLGAMKTRRISAYLSVLVLLIGAGTFLIPVAGSEATPDLVGLAFFKPLVTYLQNMFGISSSVETRLFGFLSFAYTYHYLNWFSKAEVIQWNRMPPMRLKAIIAVYAVTLLAYAFDYAVGFVLIIFLSLAHVLLEFPLNLRSFGMIARGGATASVPHTQNPAA